MFLVYSAKSFGLVKPLERLTFSGFLLFVSLAASMGLLVAFWVGTVNLVQTLWIVVLGGPVSLIFTYRGLQITKV